MGLFAEFFALSVGALLPVINPVGSSLVFLGMVGAAPGRVFTMLARRIAISTGLFLLAMDLTGAIVLRLFGISLPVVQLAGGLVLAAMGWELLNKKEAPGQQDTSPHSADVKVLQRAKDTRAKIRNLMSALFTHAMRYEWADRNPIKLVRQSAKRERIPDVLELAEIQLLLSKLGVRERTLALLDAGTGLRVSELLALRWRDVDFDNLELSVTRSIWHQVVGDCKTEASAKPVPLDSYMAEDLLRWRRQSTYQLNDDYVFASESMQGKQPYWPDNLMKRHIRPVAKANGIHKQIGWHTFRHTFSTLLKANGEDVKTVQELLRHANSRITLEVYTQATTSNKRAAQSKVVRMMVPNLGETQDEKHPQIAE